MGYLSTFHCRSKNIQSLWIPNWWNILADFSILVYMRSLSVGAVLSVIQFVHDVLHKPGQGRSEYCHWNLVPQQGITPPKFNMEPENHTLEKEKHLPNNHFGVGFRGVQPFELSCCLLLGFSTDCCYSARSCHAARPYTQLSFPATLPGHELNPPNDVFKC